MASRLAQIAVAVAVLAGPQAASAQAPTAPAPAASAPAPNQPTFPLPTEVQLDYLLANGRWNQLAAVLSRPMTADDVRKRLLWLRANIEFGGSAVLGLLYSRDLWAIGENGAAGGKAIDPAKDIRITAAEVTLYTYAVIQLAGARCEDQDAPSHRSQQLLDGRKPTLDFLARQSGDVRTKAIAAALALEQKSAPFRGNDDFVCRNDDDATRVDAAAGGTAAPPPVKYAGPAVAGPREAKIRAGLPAVLKRLVAR